MVTVYEIRRANLIRLTQEKGAKQALALKLDMTAAQISHWLRAPDRPGARLIHEDSARQIEAALGLAPGELDVPHGTKRKREVDPELLALATRTVFEEARDADLGDPAKLAEVVSLAYNQARVTGVLDREYVRQLLALLKR